MSLSLYCSSEITVGNAEDYELAWYAPEEIGFLLELSQ